MTWAGCRSLSDNQQFPTCALAVGASITGAPHTIAAEAEITTDFSFIFDPFQIAQRNLWARR
jgi:hypothetical protein